MSVTHYQNYTDRYKRSLAHPPSTYTVEFLQSQIKKLNNSPSRHYNTRWHKFTSYGTKETYNIGSVPTKPVYFATRKANAQVHNSHHVQLYCHIPWNIMLPCVHPLPRNGKLFLSLHFRPKHWHSNYKLLNWISSIYTPKFKALYTVPRLRNLYGNLL